MNLFVVLDEMWIALAEFEAKVHKNLLLKVRVRLAGSSKRDAISLPPLPQVAPPSPADDSSDHIPRYADATVALYYSHLEHCTPKWHFESALR